METIQHHETPVITPNTMTASVAVLELSQHPIGNPDEIFQHALAYEARPKNT